MIGIFENFRARVIEIHLHRKWHVWHDVFIMDDSENGQFVRYEFCVIFVANARLAEVVHGGGIARLNEI